MSHGWMGKILEIDLTSKEVSTRGTSTYMPDYIGGRALASRIAWDEIPADIEAFDKENRIIISTGPLTGTLAPTSGRCIMSSLSPRTYPKVWYTHSTIGGWFGAELKYAGYDALIIKGKAESPVFIEIHDEDVQIADADNLWGMDARRTQLELKAKLGAKTQLLAIGPAGENLVRFATVQHAEENAAGHSGFGAVWGSKKLKAIAVRGTKGVSVADPAALLSEIVNAGTAKKTPPIAVTFEGGTMWYREEEGETGVAKDKIAEQDPPDDGYGPVCTQACTFDCILGGYEQAEDGRRIPGFCIGYDWRKSILMQVTEYKGGGIEVPPGVHFKSGDEIRLHELFNNLGIDLWSRLVMQPWLIRCKQLGIDEIRGYAIDPEDLSWIKKFMYQISNREGLGDIFADDLRRAMDELEGELPEELISLGRELEFDFGFPAHREGRFFDGEPLPFWVFSAMMHISETRDPAIGTHSSSLLNAEFFMENSELSRRQFRKISEKVFGYPDAFEPTLEHKAPVAIWSQNQHMLNDSLPLCDFAFPQLVRPLKNRVEWEASGDISGDVNIGCRIFYAVTGIEISNKELLNNVVRAFTLERALLARAGRSRAMEETLAPHFKLPCKQDGTLVELDQFYQLMDEYYSARGWDLELGWPKKETLKELGLEDIIDELDTLRQSIKPVIKEN